MNPVSREEAEQLIKETVSLAEKSLEYEIVACPPFTWLADLSRKNAGKLTFGSQDVFWENSKGPYTGEISPEMLKDSGVKYVIVGHSERRRYENETDEMINKKVEAGLKAGLKVILCVGENLAVHNQGLEAVKSFIKGQLEKDLEELTENSMPTGSGRQEKLETKNLIIAYEPIWAIGTGVPENPENAALMAKYIKEMVVGVRMLYGGSVDGKNIGNFIKYEEIDGFLVGGASLLPGQFR